MKEQQGTMVYCKNCHRFLGRVFVATEKWCVRCGLATSVNSPTSEQKKAS